MLSFSVGTSDFKAALTSKLKIALTLGWVDIAQRYRRSSLGPIWLTISMAVTVLGMGLIFGTLFGVPLEEFLPYLALGMIIWSFIFSVVTEGTTVFIDSEDIIKQVALPFYTHIFRMLWRNIIIFGHNFIIFPFLILIFGAYPDIRILEVIPGFLALVLNLVWIVMIGGIFCTRYRDFPQIVSSIMQLWFFVTPIIWQPELMIEKGRAVFLDINPFYHLISVVRQPLLGQDTPYLSWVIVFAMALIGNLVAIVFFGAYRRRLAYWL